jgi:hypothetical protein
MSNEVQMPAMPPEPAAEVVQPSTQVTPTGETAEGTGASEPAAEESEADRAARLVKEDKVRRERAQKNQRQAYERLQRERDEYRQIALAAAQRNTQPPSPPPAEVADAAPKRDQFDSYEDWVRADSRYVARKEAEDAFERRMRSAAEQMSAVQAQHTEQSVAAGHFQRAQEFAKVATDFADVTDRDDIVIPPAASHAIQRMQDGPALLYAMGRDPAIAHRLNTMEPAEQLVYLGTLSAALRRPPQISKAPPPGQTVSGRSDGSKTPRDIDAYYEQVRKRRGR